MIKKQPPIILSAAVFTLAISASSAAWADESGISYWVPGRYGSLAAVPSQPGLSWAATYYHTSVNGGGSEEFIIGGQVVAGLEARADLVFFGPTYVFEQPVLGAQAAIGLTGVCGRSETRISATLTGPRGNTISGERSQSLTSCGDLYPTATLRWHKDNNNFMTYLTGDIPVGDYSPNRIVNLGIGHGAIDGGASYTYLDSKRGHEFSATAGFTYNFINPDTDYKSGIDFHLDWGASQFLSKQVFVGANGYVYQQVTGDSGSGARLGSFESRVIGIGPQLGLILPGKDFETFVGLKAYWEFDHQNRPEGWNAWLTLSFSPPAGESQKPMK